MIEQNTHTTERSGTYKLVIPDYLIDEEKLKWRLKDMLKQDVQYSWNAGSYTVYNAPVKKLDSVSELALQADEELTH